MSAQPPPLSSTLSLPLTGIGNSASTPSPSNMAFSQLVHSLSPVAFDDINHTSRDANSCVIDLWAKIQHLAEHLPEAVPIASAEDSIVHFSGDLNLLGFDKPLEAMNNVPHTVLGYNKTVNESSTIIRHRELGIDALIKWFLNCMHAWGVTGEFLEPRLE